MPLTDSSSLLFEGRHGAVGDNRNTPFGSNCEYIQHIELLRQKHIDYAGLVEAYKDDLTENE